MCISFHAINVTIFNTHSPIQHPLPLSTPSSLFTFTFNTQFHFQHPLPYSASTFTFSTHFHSSIQQPQIPCAATSCHSFVPLLSTHFHPRHSPSSYKKLLIHFAHLVPLPPSPFLFTFLDHFSHFWTTFCLSQFNRFFTSTFLTYYLSVVFHFLSPCQVFQNGKLFSFRPLKSLPFQKTFFRCKDIKFS